MTKQQEFLTNLLSKNRRAIIVTSLGTISSDVELLPHSYKVRLKGAMGAAIPCALGIALSTKRQVIAVVGDGAYLMKMGAISTVLKHNLPNLRIIVINNNSYLSCGGQSTNFSYIENAKAVPFETLSA